MSSMRCARHKGEGGSWLSLVRCQKKWCIPRFLKESLRVVVTVVTSLELIGGRDSVARHDTCVGIMKVVRPRIVPSWKNEDSGVSDYDAQRTASRYAMGSVIRYDDVSQTEVIVLENMWRDRIHVCQKRSFTLALYHKLPLCVIYYIARLAYPQVRVVDIGLYDRQSSKREYRIRETERVRAL